MRNLLFEYMADTHKPAAQIPMAVDALGHDGAWMTGRTTPDAGKPLHAIEGSPRGSDGLWLAGGGTLFIPAAPPQPATPGPSPAEAADNLAAALSALEWVQIMAAAACMLTGLLAVIVLVAALVKRL